jgi:hypothetical protein
LASIVKSQPKSLSPHDFGAGAKESSQAFSIFAPLAMTSLAESLVNIELEPLYLDNRLS